MVVFPLGMTSLTLKYPHMPSTPMDWQVLNVFLNLKAYINHEHSLEHGERESAGALNYSSLAY
jgi:hypothetical protein